MSEFHNTVYYENWTDIGGWDSHKTLNGTWETFDQAKHDMKNYANALSAKGSGWIVRVTITSQGDRGGYFTSTVQMVAGGITKERILMDDDRRFPT